MLQISTPKLRDVIRCFWLGMVAHRTHPRSWDPVNEDERWCAFSFYHSVSLIPRTAGPNGVRGTRCTYSPLYLFIISYHGYTQSSMAFLRVASHVPLVSVRHLTLTLPSKSVRLWEMKPVLKVFQRRYYLFFLLHSLHVSGCHVLLAPTMNTQRSPLGGRGFESFSEDPHLNGTIGGAYIQGVQSKGVAATIKHYVGESLYCLPYLIPTNI